jgi:hypothetical protein
VGGVVVAMVVAKPLCTRKHHDAMKTSIRHNHPIVNIDKQISTDTDDRPTRTEW